MKISGKQQPLVTVFLLTLVSIAYCSLLVSEAKSQTPKLLSQNEYPQDFTEVYQASCKINAVTKGLSTEQAETLCDCTLNQFQSKYTLEKFQKLMNKAAKEETPEELIEVGEICAEELIN
ncbi:MULTISPECIES: hypothetical protein [unclassified Okeania]|uniref:hypothetical protein n=1 Tax=unclassified Okeania TaxID=2634635 RepID=UPI0013B8BB54|nr:MULTISPECIES: hypothetical protein [unclassified Okeania]NES78318.1 hypothetical protein [Okeania sp. SIO1H4]NET16849.1 hypothetical protein [Okeania sp. SIO1H6]NET21657.1 hypothetical protein [Okeania sp. SIO1H5]NET95006.1 hypothetical protein [Okeania sp. SIO1H2]